MSETKLLITPISFLVNRLPETYVAPFQPYTYTPLISFLLGAETAAQTGKQQEAAVWKTVRSKDLYRYEKGISFKFTQKPVKPSSNLPAFMGKQEERDKVKVAIRHDAYLLTGTFDPYGLPCGGKRNIYVKMEDHLNKYKALIKLSVSVGSFGVDPAMFEAGGRVSNVAKECRKLGEVLRDGVLVLKKVKEGNEECTMYHGIREAIEKEVQSNKASTLDITLCVFKGSYAWYKPVVIPASTYNVSINIIALNRSEILAQENTPMFIVDYLTEFTLNMHKIAIPLGTTTIFLKNCMQRKVACAIHANSSEIGDIKADSDISAKVANREGMRLHALNEALEGHSNAYIATIYHSEYPILTEYFGTLMGMKTSSDEVVV